MASTLDQRQLLKISADIANGMVHLSSQKVCDALYSYIVEKPNPVNLLQTTTSYSQSAVKQAAVTQIMWYIFLRKNSSSYSYLIVLYVQSRNVNKRKFKFKLIYYIMSNAIEHFWKFLKKPD